jgi:heme/copper-type cytochrome/quinol oxidase subunit 2
MQQSRSIGVIRNILTVIGLLLLVVFGARAAAQARDMRLAGSIRPNLFIISSPIQLVVTMGHFAAERVFTLKAAAPVDGTATTALQTTTSQQPNGDQDTSLTATGLDRARSVSSTASSLNEGVRVTPNGKKVLPASVNQTLKNTQSTVNNVTKSVDDTKNQFVRLLP